MDLFTLNLTIEGIAAILSLFGFLGILFVSGSEKKEKIILLVLFGLFFVISLSDGFFRYFNGKEGVKYVVLGLRSLSEAAGVAFLALTNTYVFVLSHRKSKSFLIQNAVGFSVAGLFIILLLINLFTGFLFGIDENNVLYHAKGYFLMAIIEGVLWVWDAVSVILNRKHLFKQDAITFLIWFLMFAVGLCLEMVFPAIATFAMFGIWGILVKLFSEISKERTRITQEKEEAERLRKDVTRTKEKLFQSQVSPHFIYNALTAIRELPDNPVATKKAIGDFAKYLRQTLTTINENELIPFEKELENVQAYLRLEKIRFGNSLKVVYDVKVNDFQLPAMCVQILAENAVKHGVSVKREGGTVFISTEKQDDFILITVRDDGVGFDVEKALDPSHVGINNVKNRIGSILNGEVEIKSQIGSGTTAIIKLPCA